MNARIKVTSIANGYLHGIDTETGSREDFHYSRKVSGNFAVYGGCIVLVEYVKNGHRPKRILSILDCIHEREE